MDTSDLAQKVKEARTVKGLSQEALAQHSNISLRTVQRIEKGIVPRASTLRILCDALDLNLNQFISSENNNTLQRDVRILKRMNLLIIVFLLVPFGTIVFPFLLWKTGKKLDQRSGDAGKIISFQIIWIITSFLLFFAGVFITNLITGNAGNSLYVSLLILGACLIWNILLVVRSTIELNSDNTEFLKKTPNFF